MDITINKDITVVSVGVLHTTLQSAIGAHYLALSTTPGKVIAHLDDAATVGEVSTATSTITAFDPNSVPDPIVTAKADIAQALTDKGATAFDGLTVQQAVDYINTNVTTLATAKPVMVIMAKHIGWMERRIKLLESKAGL